MDPLSPCRLMDCFVLWTKKIDEMKQKEMILRERLKHHKNNHDIPTREWYMCPHPSCTQGKLWKNESAFYNHYDSKHSGSPVMKPIKHTIDNNIQSVYASNDVVPKQGSRKRKASALDIESKKKNPMSIENLCSNDSTSDYNSEPDSDIVVISSTSDDEKIDEFSLYNGHTKKTVIQNQLDRTRVNREELEANLKKTLEGIVKACQSTKIDYGEITKLLNVAMTTYDNVHNSQHSDHVFLNSVDGVNK